MISRVLAGCFGAAPIAIVCGSYVDFLDAMDRGVATAAFAGATFLGPVAGLIAGEFIMKSELGWRWIAGVTMIASAVFGIVAVATVLETFAPVLLKRKAERLRRETGNLALRAPGEEKPVRLRELGEKYFSKPFVMLFQEPIVSTPDPYYSKHLNGEEKHVLTKGRVIGVDVVFESGIQHPLPHLLRLSLLLPLHSRLAIRNRLPPLPRHPNRHRPLLSLHHHRYTHLLQPLTPPFSETRNPRSTSPTHDGRLHHPAHWPLLVRVDFGSRYHLGTTGPLRHPNRLWDPARLLTRPDLHCRRVPPQRK